jgi:hypothetical protein
MQHVRTQPQDERVSEPGPRLYQVPGHRTYGASVYFLRYVPSESRHEHMLYVMRHDRTVPKHELERVSESPRRLYQVPNNRTYGTPVHFLRYV